MKPYINTTVVAAVCVLAVSACSDATGTGSDDGVPVVQIAERDVTLSVGDSARLTLLPLLPPGVIPEDLRWSSSDPAILTLRQVNLTAAMVTSMRTGRVVVHVDADDARDSVEVVVQ